MTYALHLLDPIVCALILQLFQRDAIAYLANKDEDYFGLIIQMCAILKTSDDSNDSGSNISTLKYSALPC